MKKILSIILTITMLLTVSVASVSAATAIDGGEGTSSTGKTDGDYTLGVGADYTAGIETAATVISVDIAWESMEFTYTAGSIGIWDATNHKYTGATDGGWSDRKSTITVTNHSNTVIKAEFDFAMGTGVTGLKGVFTNDNVIVDSADADTYRVPDPDTGVYPAPKNTTQFGIDPTSDPITEDKSTLGTIIVSIKKVTIASTEKELDEAFDALKATGGIIMLGADLTLDPYDDNRRVELYANSGTPNSPIIFDLGGYTLSGWVSVLENSYVTIQNGAIRADRSYGSSDAAAIKVEGGGVLVLKDVIITNTGAGAALYLAEDAAYAVTMDNCLLDTNSPVSVYAQSELVITMTLKNKVVISGQFACNFNTATITLAGGGEYNINTSNFEPENDLVLNPKGNSDHRPLFQ